MPSVKTSLKYRDTMKLAKETLPIAIGNRKKRDMGDNDIEGIIWITRRKLQKYAIFSHSAHSIVTITIC